MKAQERYDTLIIGAGQAGLAAAYHLTKRKIDAVVLEAKPRVGDVWRERYDSLLLYTPAKYDALPGLALPLPGHVFPTGRQMADYLEAYAAHHRLPVRTGQRVDRVRAADGGGFEIVAGDARYAARAVIVATGTFQRPHVPDFAVQLDPRIRQLHSADYHSPADLAAGPVLVVGASHSGPDIAYEVARAGHRTLMSGADHGQLPFSVDSLRMRFSWPLMRFMTTRVLTIDTPVGRKVAAKMRGHGGPLLRVRRPDMRRAGIERHAARVTGVQDGLPLLADGSVLDVANVIWATGFRPDYSWLELPIDGANGWPRQHRGVVESVPGLYFLGLPFQYAFGSMLVLGASRDAAYVVDRIVGRQAGTPAAARASQLETTPAER